VKLFPHETQIQLFLTESDKHETQDLRFSLQWELNSSSGL